LKFEISNHCIILDPVTYQRFEELPV